MRPFDRSRALVFLVAGAFFMENLDGTVLTTALPGMARAFGTDAVALNVGITAYLLALAVFVPMSGWIADRYGARTVFAAALAGFTLASVLCGLSGNVSEFVLARVLQGVAGAMMVPVGRLVVLRNTPKDGLVDAISTIVWPGLVAPVLGPPLGGLITTYASWRLIFFLNVPLGLAALALALRLVPDTREDDSRPFDWWGFALLGLACGLLTTGLDRVAARPVPWAQIAGLLLVGVGLTVAAVRHLRTCPHPLLRLDALRVPTFLAALRGGSMARCAIGAMPFLLALLFQVGFGLTAAGAGLLVLWTFAGNLAMKTVTSRVLRRFGFRKALLANGLGAVLAILAVIPLTPATPYAVVAATLFVGGMTRSMQFTAVNTLSFADVRDREMGAASTLSSTIVGLVFGLGVAFAAVALRFAVIVHRNPGPNPSLADFRLALLLVAALCALSLWDFFRLPRDAGEAIVGGQA